MYNNLENAKDKEKKVNSLEPEYEKRGIVVGNNVYNLQRQYEGQVFLDDEGKLHFPVLFLYEEHNQSDFVQDFHEDHTFEEHLNYMFPDGSNPPWDNGTSFFQ